MGRGVRGIRKCPCDDNLLWGVTGTDRHIYQYLIDNAPVFQFVRAIRVRAKIAPYNAPYGSTGIGEVPAVWSDGPEYTLPAPIGVISDSNTSRCYLGSRAVYEDGKQKYVNYVMSDNALLMQSPTWWSRIHVDDEAATDGFFIGDIEDFELPVGHTIPFTLIGDIVLASLDEIVSPQQWYAGYRYFAFSNYRPKTNEILWSTKKFDNTTGTWTEANQTGFDSLVYAVVQPTHRAYSRTAAAQPDEPWVMAVKQDTRTWVTGRWINTDLGSTGDDHHLEAGEIGRTIWAGASATIALVRYNRIGNRDLAIFIDTSTDEHHIYDGNEIIAISDAPTYITADKEGNILYGNSAFIKKLGPGNVTLWTLFPTSPGGAGPHPDMFQIVCNDTWIMVHGLEAGEDFATSTLSGTYNGLPYDYVAFNPSEPQENNILSWSLSYNGEIRIPHVQILQPLPTDVDDITDPVDPYPVEPSPSYRINGREYQSDDQSVWESLPYPPAGGNNRPWNLHGSGVQNQWGNGTLHGTTPWDPLEWGLLSTPTQCTDYDIVDIPCTCGCRGPVNY